MPEVEHGLTAVGALVPLNTTLNLTCDGGYEHNSTLPGPSSCGPDRHFDNVPRCVGEWDIPNHIGFNDTEGGWD